MVNFKDKRTLNSFLVGHEEEALGESANMTREERIERGKRLYAPMKQWMEKTNKKFAEEAEKKKKEGKLK